MKRPFEGSRRGKRRWAPTRYQRNAMTPGHDKILEPLNDDPVLRFEYYAMRTHNVLDGERALMFAVLVDALDPYVKTRSAKGHRKRAEFNEVESWIRSRNTGSPFAFENISDSL